MKKVVKVSVGNFAFTLNEDAYELLHSYLEDLNSHYRNKPNGSEVIEGIEERIAELFSEKIGQDTVISIEIVSEVVNILGMPDDFDEDSSHGTQRTEQINPSAKKIFRNIDNKIIGGVCSGFATYFSADVTLVRILFIIVFLGFSIFGFQVGGFPAMILFYVILMIIIPKAVTVEQKCAMYGEKPDISNIQKRVNDVMNQGNDGAKRTGSQGGIIISGFFNVVVKVMGILLLLIGFTGIVSLTTLFLGVEIIDGIVPLDVLDFISIDHANILVIKILGLLALFLPFIGMSYGGIQMLFGFKAPKYRPGLIIFVLWMLSCIGLVGVAAISTRGFWVDSHNTKEIVIKNKLDTLYVKFVSQNPMPSSRVIYESNDYRVNLYWMDGKGDIGNITAFPELKIFRIADQDSSYIRTDVQAQGHTWAEANTKAESQLPIYELKDSLLTIYPDIYSKSKKWDGIVKEISLHIPENVKVIVTEPVNNNNGKWRDCLLDW